jgi:hypothetical protein
LAFLKRKQKDVQAPPSHRYATASEMNEGGVPVSIIGEAFPKKVFHHPAMDEYLWTEENRHACSAWNVPVPMIPRRETQKGYLPGDLF